VRRAAQVALLVWATASAGGCRRAVEQEARGKERPAKPAKEARVDTVTDAALKQQFADAALCANRMQCAALDALRDRAVSADGGDQVAKVGLAILADPTSLSDQGPGKFAFKVLRDYIDHQQQAGLLTDAKKRWLVDSLRGVIDSGTQLRVQAYTLLADPPSYQLPDVEKILMSEVDNTKRSRYERVSAAAHLGPYQKDHSLFKQWMASSDPDRWREALAVEGSYKTGPTLTPEEHKEQVALILQLSKRPNLPDDLIESLMFWMDVFVQNGDGAPFKPMLQKIANGSYSFAGRADWLVGQLDSQAQKH
jgi:hypothetical protein